MKKTLKSIVCSVLAVVFVFSLASCGAGGSADADTVWENAVCREDTELGTGARTVVVEVKVGEHIVTFTVHTDQNTVGAALIEHGLIEGEEGPYGMYIKSVNGMVADYDVDRSYWSFYADGEYAMSSADLTEIEEGVTYQLAYTRE